MKISEPSEFGKSSLILVTFCSVVLVGALVVSAVLPSKNETKKVVANSSTETETEIVADLGNLVEEAGFKSSKLVAGDEGLSLYRQPSSKNAVEWFYLHITGSKEIAMSILEEAERNNVPLSLAFALAYTESRYKTDAVNKNRNASIDRGLFQLNNRSFPQLKEADFFNPAVSAKYGMAHLRFCMNVAGNEVMALAMYNAGTNKVKNDRTPESTLKYIGKIMAYREKLDKLFAEEVSPYFDNDRYISGNSIAYLNAKRFEKF